MSDRPPHAHRMVQARHPDGARPVINVHEGNPAVVTDLIARGADPNRPDDDGLTALMAASEQARGDVVAALLAGGADARARTPRGYTALHFAARAGDVTVARQLLESNARADARTFASGDGPGFTPYEIAVNWGGMDPNDEREALVRLLARWSVHQHLADRAPAAREDAHAEPTL